MTLICDMCKKPLKAEDNKPMTFGSRTLDFHKGCDDKFIERMIGVGASNPVPPTVPREPVPARPAPLPEEEPKKKHWWQSNKTKKVAKNIEKWAEDESKEMKQIADEYLKGWGEG